MEGLNQYSSIVTTHAHKPCRILFAHGSQLDFGELNARGRQCSCVAMYFLAAAEWNRNLSSWISSDLTKILEAGTDFYESVDQKWKDSNGFVDLEGLMGEIKVKQGILQMEIPHVDHGVLSSAVKLAGVMEVLERAVERVVALSSSFIIVTNSYSLGLYVENGFAYIFNSHCCGLLGDSATTGNACVIQIELAEAAKFVSSYIENNYGSRVNLSHMNLHHHTFCIYRVKFTRGNAVNHKEDFMRPKISTPGLSIGFVRLDRLWVLSCRFNFSLGKWSYQNYREGSFSVSLKRLACTCAKQPKQVKSMRIIIIIRIVTDLTNDNPEDFTQTLLQLFAFITAD